MLTFRTADFGTSLPQHFFGLLSSRDVDGCKRTEPAIMQIAARLCALIESDDEHEKSYDEMPGTEDAMTRLLSGSYLGDDHDLSAAAGGGGGGGRDRYGAKGAEEPSQKQDELSMPQAQLLNVVLGVLQGVGLSRRAQAQFHRAAKAHKWQLQVGGGREFQAQVDMYIKAGNPD